MYKIKLKQFDECLRLNNVITSVRQFRNSAIDRKKQARKAKDKEEQQRISREIANYEQSLLDLERQLQVAEQANEIASIECAIMRTKVYVLSYCLQGAVFDLKSFLAKNAVSDGGELGFLTQLKECSDLLMKMPNEFGTYGKDNEAYNVCEEIISNEVDRGIRATFKEMLDNQAEALRKKFNHKA